MAQFDTEFSWESLTWADLKWWYTLQPAETEEERMKQRFELWMRLMHLELLPEEEDDVVMNDEFTLMYQFKKKGDKSNDVYCATLKEITALLLHFMKFLDEPIGKKNDKTGEWIGGMMVLPVEEVRIGRRRFHLPEMLIANLTYQQYTNIQKLSQVVWSMVEEIKAEQDNVKKTLERLQKLQAKDVSNERREAHQRKVKMVEQELKGLAEKMQKDMNDLHDAKARVMAHLLTTRKLQFTGNSDGGGTHIDIHWTWPYSPEVAERMVPFMAKHCEEWMFEVLQQHIQSCLAVYKTQFPELFGDGGGGGSDKLPFISETESVNAVMKWQSYTNQQAVYDSNAVFIFSILNSMTKEAKAIEEANAKMKSHRK